MSDQTTELAGIIALMERLKDALPEAERWPMIAYLTELALEEAKMEFYKLAKKERERAGGMN